MKTDPKQQQESEAQRDLVARLSAAILRINASLEPDTVLREVLDSARALTGARYGVITTVDEAGQVQDFVSSGIGPEEHRQLAGWSDGPRLFEHFRAQPGALRLDDLPAYVRSLGFSADLIISKTFQGTPMRHRGQEVGLFFLAGKEDGQTFTPEDEEVLKLFASQAATAIANARVHRDEQRARADLEALVDTSPVGVVVLDARTGRPVSFNREAKRIVEGLRMPGRSLEQLLEVLTFRRADGQEVSLEKLGMAQALSTGETVRAEEIVLEVPDGRRVRTLVNATPIRSGDGEVESVVVTLQDLSPMEELERLRSEFLDLVSHELRAPLTSIKWLCTATVLGVLAGAAPGRDAAVLPAHRRAGRAHVEPDPRPAGSRAHRGRHPVGDPRIFRCERPGGSGPDHVPERGQPASRPDRPAVGPAPGDGRPAAHRAGPEQPAGQRRPALARGVTHPDRRRAR